MYMRSLALSLMGGTALITAAHAQTATPAPTTQAAAAPTTNIGEIQAQEAPKPVLKQKGLTASPTDFAEEANKAAQKQSAAASGPAQMPGIGSGPVRPTTPGGVTGQDLGGGYMIEEEAKKTRSTITRDAIDKQGPSANPYQLINLLPGVVQSSTDNTGANGGNIRMRGFNSDHVGLTIEGMPVNDSGNYALYPQEYVDADNIEQISIAQGSPELDSPHIGSAGGVINIYMRDPSKEAGGMTSFSVGSDNYFREFVRVESGQVGPVRAYLSYSRLDKDHWVGEGEDTRDHIDFKAVYDISPGNTIRFSGLYNEAVNNFYRQPNLARFEKEGKNSAAYDSKLPTTFFSGTPLNQASAAQGLEATNYYKYRVNPFKNLILSAPSNFKLTENLRFDTIPYYWYGFGNGGGTGELREAGAFSGNNRITGVDFGGNLGAGTDRVLYYNPSITETNRPGVINKFTLDVADHTIVAGHWYEYASHRQTAPFIPLNADGSIAGDVWGEDNNYTLPSTATCRITSTAGSGSGQTAGTVVPCPTGPLQRRDQKTETTTSMFFVGDSWNITNWLKLDAGVKHVSIKRDINNYLPDANPGNTELSDDVTLPTAGVSIQLNKEHQIFGSYNESFRSAPNFTLTAGYSITSGAFTPVTEVEPERGQIYEIGHRYQGSLFATSVSGFYGEFENYQQSTNRIDTASGGTASVFQTINLGGVRNYGVNGEIGTRPIYNFRPYVSGELLRTEILDNLEARTTAGTTDYLRTAGKELPGAPRYSFGVGVDYDNGHFFANLAYKYTGSQYSTLVNDEEIDGFGRLDAAIGYRFGDIGYMKQPEVKLSLFNVLDSVDLVGVSGVQNNAKVATGVNGGTIAGNTGNFAPTYYVGQDFSALVTFKTGF